MQAIAVIDTRQLQSYPPICSSLGLNSKSAKQERSRSRAAVSRTVRELAAFPPPCDPPDAVRVLQVAVSYAERELQLVGAAVLRAAPRAAGGARSLDSGAHARF